MCRVVIVVNSQLETLITANMNYELDPHQNCSTGITDTRRVGMEREEKDASKLDEK